jgi:hypothetical protein
MRNRWGEAKGDGEEGGEVSIQSTRDQSGRESHHDAKEGFQVSKKGFRDGAEISKQGGCKRDWVMHSGSC